MTCLHPKNQSRVLAPATGAAASWQREVRNAFKPGLSSAALGSLSGYGSGLGQVYCHFCTPTAG